MEHLMGMSTHDGWQRRVPQRHHVGRVASVVGRPKGEGAKVVGLYADKYPGRRSAA